MIEKMKFISITGPEEKLDEMTKNHLSRYEIQLENAAGQLKNMKNIVPGAQNNPYREALEHAKKVAALFENEPCAGSAPEPEKAAALIEAAWRTCSEMQEAKSALQDELSHKEKLLSDIKPFYDLDFEFSSLIHFKEINLRFGRMPVGFYEQLMTYVYDDICSIFEKCSEDKECVWGVYFVPAFEAKKVDAIYASLHFERLWLEDAYTGTPKQACLDLEQEIKTQKEKIAEKDRQLIAELSGQKEAILSAKEALLDASLRYEIRRKAAFVKEKEGLYFILCGWMVQKDAQMLDGELSEDKDIFCTLEENPDRRISIPPTKLKNPKLLRPFEMYTRMYGLPDYEEFDPTPFIALTYSVIFGAMFGDVGQGLCLLFGGLILYKVKKMNLAAIVACCGFFSAVFGFLYGSVFGFENILSPIWLRPTEAMTNLPFIGKLNTVFVVSIALGMGLILLTMVFQMINAFRAKDFKAALFDTNGLAGFLFYGTIVAAVVLYMTGHSLPAAVVLIVMLGVPAIVMACKELLGEWLEKKTAHLESGPVMFVVEAFFELFEVCLSYFSNTLSFVRIGAFAVSHAAMMEVVLMLAGAENGSAGNPVVIVLGNLIVMGMEGLIVGIQGLRLQYYEFFSRFYKGDGREFTPFPMAAHQYKNPETGK